ncbi:hypothetical protein JVU11DRAFT_9013 [Chiua virens]|nr:hypothetical protein JVU11DRAFT_9013 [Chiua virens]
MTGGFIRVKTYRALGQFFKFELCILRGHKLITTGPYAVVRHPSYTGLLLCIVGSSIVYGSRGSWLRDSGVLRARWVRAAFGGWGLIMLASVLTMIRRSTEEDSFLSESFGKEWENWARRVKYKLVPFVY